MPTTSINHTMNLNHRLQRVAAAQCSCCHTPNATGRTGKIPTPSCTPQVLSSSNSTNTSSNLKQSHPPSAQAALLSGAGVTTASLTLSAATAAAAQAATDSLVLASTSTGHVPSPMEGPTWQIWVGFAAGVIPFIIASYEFGKRIVIQRRCPECQGRGLVQRGKLLKKCMQCGGMLPWLGWRAFWFSNFRPGNGGPLLQPKGQKSVFYSVPPPPPAAGSSEGERQKNSVGGDE